jgi:putative transposon-encoded protein
LTLIQCSFNVALLNIGLDCNLYIRNIISISYIEEAAAESPNSKVKFEIYGEEMIEKRVKSSGNSGRVYLPPNWVGHKVKIIRTD